MSQQRQQSLSDAELARKLHEEQEAILEEDEELAKVLRLSAQEASARESLARATTRTSAPVSDKKSYNPSSTTSTASQSNLSSSTSSSSTGLSQSQSAKPTTSTTSTTTTSQGSSEDLALARRLQEEEDLKLSRQIEEETSRRGRRFMADDDLEFPAAPVSGARPSQHYVQRFFHQPGSGQVSFVMSSSSGGTHIMPMGMQMQMQHSGLPMAAMQLLGHGPMMPFPFQPSVDVDSMSYEELLELGERLGQVKRGAPVEAITQLPTSKFRKKIPTLSSSPPTSTSIPSPSPSSTFSTSPPKGGTSSPTETKAAPAPSEEKSCCICLEDFQDGEDIRRLPCFHIFHQDEIDKWLRDNNSCPICKTPIPTTSATES